MRDKANKMWLKYMVKRIIECSIITALILLMLWIGIKYQERNYTVAQAKERQNNIVFEIVSIQKNETVEVKLPNFTDIAISTENSDKKEEVQKEVATEMSTEEILEPVVEEIQYVTEPYIIECTAYNPTGKQCCDGTWPVEGVTVAGKKSWLGRSCRLYYLGKDNTIGKLIGTYTFHDTGFGHDPDGDGIGSIETGERIDLFMDSYTQAVNWGVQKVWIEFLD